MSWFINSFVDLCTLFVGQHGQLKECIILEPIVSAFFHKIIFYVNHFKSLYLICYNIASLLYFFVCKALGILAPQPGIKPIPPALEVQSLNHRNATEIHVRALLIFCSLFFSFLPLPFLPPSPFPPPSFPLLPALPPPPPSSFS